MHRLSAHPLAELLELRDIEPPNPLAFRGRKRHGDIPVLPADDDGLALRGIEQRGKPLLRAGGTYVAHRDLPGINHHLNG